MASLTVRKLDDEIKAALKLRAAKSGRSVEDEVRVILREAAEGPQAPAECASPGPTGNFPSRPRSPPRNRQRPPACHPHHRRAASRRTRRST